MHEKKIHLSFLEYLKQKNSYYSNHSSSWERRYTKINSHTLKISETQADCEND